MIIDAHGHYTTVPSGMRVFRALQISNMGRPKRSAVNISDDEIRASLVKGQIKLLDERGVDVMLFSPMASAMGHHFGNALVSRHWTEVSNELVHRACSGVYVTTRRTWEAHGGQDERFRGWGFEDVAWYLAHETLLGAPPQRHEGRVYALNHAVETRAGDQYERNAGLMQRYRDAAGDAAAMAGLVAEAQSVSAAKARSGPGAAA